MREYYKSGDHNAVCDRCGYEYKFSQLKKTWDGLWVCHKDWEPRHPQDFVRGIPDEQRPSVTRPEVPDGTSFVGTANTITTTSPYAFVNPAGTYQQDVNATSTTILDPKTGTSYLSSTFTFAPLTGNITINTPLNPTVNQLIEYQFSQDQIGGRSITWNAVFTGISILGTTSANKMITILFQYNGTNWIQIGSAEWI